MKIKIGDKIYDANEEPVMLIFSGAEERITVANHLKYMSDEALRYCMFPDKMDKEVIKEFMKIK